MKLIPSPRSLEPKFDFVFWLRPLQRAPLWDAPGGWCFQLGGWVGAREQGEEAAKPRYRLHLQRTVTAGRIQTRVSYFQIVTKKACGVRVNKKEV